VSPDTPSLWTGGTYNFTFEVPADYPMKAPKVHCNTPVYHPNIDYSGNVCLNILRKDWTAVCTIENVIYGLIYLFFDPEPTDPLNIEVGK